ncbi:26266_t:CDS:2, partial [Racocetra persica]
NDRKEFWSRSDNPAADKANLKMLYELGCLKADLKDSEGSNNIITNHEHEDIFWNSFRSALTSNKRGGNGKTQALSIIANQFEYLLLHEKLQVSMNAINLAQKHSRLYRPGAPQIKGPKKRIERMAEIKEKQFLAFFQDKNNVAQSSYKIDTKTGIPILYMQDQKQAL